ncbi:MAG TPA: helix-turn-helix domain-containing protein [Candidatus Eisenbacteria bacterium]|nr:helix-turn-helix domain-containing protein [Candidatus Eisenbacteria bacterium]
MSRKRFDDMPCSIARALDLVGDWWTLLIIREAFLGVRRFADFRDHLGIARNILSDRLRRLVAEGILSKQPKSAPDRGHEYRLTEKGRDLWAVLTALRLWGDKWVYGAGKEPVLFRDRDRGAVVMQLLPADADGNPLDPRRLVAIPGPGTSPEVVERYRTSAARRS